MNQTRILRRIVWAAAGTVLSGALLPAAVAQEGAGVRGSAAAEIIVTTRKREESLQSVPVAVTAFTEEAIRRQEIENINDLALYTPGLVYQDISAGLSLPVVRGLAQTTIVGDNNVGMFLNGIYLANNRTLDLGMVQLERIEVIKGPQSALYGQNSFAGAINYITRGPSETFDARLEGTVGTDELFELAGSVSGPITDSLSGIATVAWKDFDGTFDNDNPATGDNLQGGESAGASATLQWAPNDRFLATLFGYYTDVENDQPAQFLIPNNCGLSAQNTPTTYCGKLPNSGRFDINDAGAYGRDAQNTILALNLSYEFAPGWSVKSQTAWADSENATYRDFDYTSGGVPFAVRDIDTQLVTGTVLANTYLGQGFPGDMEDFSQELRFEFSGERLDALVGGYWYDSEREDGSVAGVDSSGLGPNEEFVSLTARVFATDDPIGSPVESNFSTEDVETIAVFGRLGYQATEKLRLGAELRWAEDEKSINRVLSFGSPVLVNPQQKETFDYVTPRVTVDYQIADDVLLYAVYAEGVRTGGFNARATIQSEQAYDPEENKTYELGVKTQWLDRRLTANLALFHIDWTDMQINSRSEDPNNIFSVVRNTGKVRSDGLEIETSYLVTDNALLGVTYAYTDPRFQSGSEDLGLASQCGVDASVCPDGTRIGGQQVGRTVKHQFSAYVAVDGQLTSNWNWFARGDAAYQGQQPTSALNTAYLDSFTVVNGRLGIENERYEIALWSKNVFDEAYATASSNQPRFHVGSTNDVTYGNGRIVGLSALARFGR